MQFQPSGYGESWTEWAFGKEYAEGQEGWIPDSIPVIGTRSGAKDTIAQTAGEEYTYLVDYVPQSTDDLTDPIKERLDPTITHEKAKTPIHKKWWFLPAVAAGVVGLVVVSRR